jgi:hypothetical protein
MKIDINRPDWYIYKDEYGTNDRTRNRLIELNEMGCEEVGVAEFGVDNIVSGLYIERVWNMSDETWVDYINWMKQLIKEKSWYTQKET